MDYLITFFEGIITFISPCILPMIPIYLSYFTGQEAGGRGRALLNAAGFVLGFTLVFTALGAFAGVLGVFLRTYQTVVNIVLGMVMILFGLHYMSVIRLPFFQGAGPGSEGRRIAGFLPAVAFGMIFSISWTPCVGAFLGSALMLAASRGDSVKGILMLLSFSLGLGLPFLISALLIDRLKSSFDFIKRHYRIITLISGIFLVIIGILMATGLLGRFLNLLTIT